MAADIYTHPTAAGHGGWSLYTGAVSWYYRVVLEDLLGLKLRGAELAIEPQLPQEWRGEEVVLAVKVRGTEVTIVIRQGEKKGLICNGAAAEAIPLDGGVYAVEVFV